MSADDPFHIRLFSFSLFILYSIPRIRPFFVFCFAFVLDLSWACNHIHPSNQPTMRDLTCCVRELRFGPTCVCVLAAARANGCGYGYEDGSSGGSNCARGRWRRMGERAGGKRRERKGASADGMERRTGRRAIVLMKSLRCGLPEPQAYPTIPTTNTQLLRHRIGRSGRLGSTLGVDRCRLLMLRKAHDDQAPRATDVHNHTTGSLGSAVHLMLGWIECSRLPWS